MGQVTLADNNGHLSARFCVMRHWRRRILDLSMRVTVYNPLTASSYWRMAPGNFCFIVLHLPPKPYNPSGQTPKS